MALTPPSEAPHFVLWWNHDGRGLYSSYTAPASRMDGVISPGHEVHMPRGVSLWR